MIIFKYNVQAPEITGIRHHNVAREVEPDKIPEEAEAIRLALEAGWLAERGYPAKFTLISAAPPKYPV